MASQANRQETDREIIVSRRFNAPRKMVFDAWTTPERLAQWWGPREWRTTTSDMTFAPGGIWRFIMHSPNGEDIRCRIVYREIQPPERIEYIQSGFDPAGLDYQTTVTFEEIEGQTEVTFHATWSTKELRDQAVEMVGWRDGARETLDRLANTLGE